MENTNLSVCVIGVSNIDIHIKCDQHLEKDRSIMGNIFVTSGGVGRNIAVGLSELGLHVFFISIFSKDVLSDMLLKQLIDKKINLDHSIMEAESTSTYADIVLQAQEYGVNCISNINDFTVPFFKSEAEFLNKMNYIVLDLNMKEDSLDYLINNVKTKIICDATSSIKCMKIRKYLDFLYVLKANWEEACKIANYDNNVDYNTILDFYLESGVKKTYITLGDKGVLYACKKSKFYVKVKRIETNSTLGVGDNFFAAVIYGIIMGWKDEKILCFSNNIALYYLKNARNEIDREIIKNSLKMMDENNIQILCWNEEQKLWKEKEKF